MKKALITCILFLGTSFGLLGMAPSTDQMPGPDPVALWNYITKVSPYTKWSFWPDHSGMQAGRAPHAPLHKVYVNGLALDSSTPPVQNGSIEVKENYSKAGELKALTVMYKVRGYNPSGGDWFWVKYTPEGKADKFGKLSGCINCHASQADNDYILVHEFK